MALGKLWAIGFRDLGRNRRRSILTLMAVALGLALVIFLSSFVAGTMEGSLQNSIRLKTGHAQIRALSYEEEKLSLKWADLLENPDQLTARANGMSEVKAAAPVLWASGVLMTLDDTIRLQVFGIETASEVFDPIREAVVAGQFLTADDRDGVIIGKHLADKLGIGVGQKVSLSVNTADGQPDEGIFTVRGLFATGVLGYDDFTVFMPLSKAQAFTHTSGRASAIIMLLHRQEDAAKVTAALSDTGLSALTWEDLNTVFLEAIQSAMAFYVMMYGIVMMVVAVVIANTLLMAAFERTREIGILAALGMKRRQIMLMFMLEATTMALVGIVLGAGLGSAAALYWGKVGIYIGEVSASVGNMITYGEVLYTRLVLGDVISLATWTLIVILLASLYPARFASRLEPVDALRAQ